METIRFECRNMDYPVGDNPLKALVFAKECAKRFKRIKVFDKSFVNVWCRGSSGAILAALFVSQFPSSKMIRIVHVKKDGEQSHGNSTIFNYNNLPENSKVINIIIDDFIVSGETVRKINEKMEKREMNVNCLIVQEYNKLIPEVLMERVGFVPDYLITSHT